MIKHDIKKYEYFVDPINSTDNERIVELRLAFNWYEKLVDFGHKNNIVEIGNVMGFYGYCEHKCIDKFAINAVRASPDASDGLSPAGEVMLVDALDEDLTGKDIVCVSTIEHIGMAEYENPTPNDGKDAIVLLDKIVNEAQSYFISFGPNHNSTLDDYVKSNISNYDWYGWCRTGLSDWDFTAKDMKVWDGKIDDPFPSANSIILLQKTLN